MKFHGRKLRVCTRNMRPCPPGTDLGALARPVSYLRLRLHIDLVFPPFDALVEVVDKDRYPLRGRKLSGYKVRFVHDLALEFPPATDKNRRAGAVGSLQDSLATECCSHLNIHWLVWFAARRQFNNQNVHPTRLDRLGILDALVLQVSLDSCVSLLRSRLDGS